MTLSPPEPEYVIALDVGGTGMKAALVGPGRPGACSTRRAGPPSARTGPEAVVEGILDFAAELRAYGSEQLGAEPVGGGGRRARHPRRRPPASPCTPPTSAGATSRCARCSPSGSAASPWRSGTTCGRAGSPRAGIGAGRGVDRFFFVALGTGIAGAHRHRRPGRGGRPRLRGRDRPRRRTPGRAPVRLRAARLPGDARLRRARWAAPGPRRAADASATAADSAEAVESGDERAVAVWRDAVDALADGLVTALTLLDPRHADHRRRAGRGRRHPVHTAA